jgi:hypothetical protein
VSFDPLFLTCIYFKFSHDTTLFLPKQVFLLIEMIARVIKGIIRKDLRASSDSMDRSRPPSESISRGVIISYLNTVFETSVTSKHFWEKTLRDAVKTKFGIDAVGSYEQNASMNRHASSCRSQCRVEMERIIPRSLCLLLIRLQKMLWIFWPAHLWDDYVSRPNAFRFVIIFVFEIIFQYASGLRSGA